MNCPKCQTALIVLEHDLLEVDYCTACRGIWLDAGELELLLGARQSAGEFLRGGSGFATQEAARRCPICRRKMDKESFNAEAPVTYDVCKRHGMWFDAGELEALLKHGNTVKDGAAVSGWLRDVFGASEISVSGD